MDEQKNDEYRDATTDGRTDGRLTLIVEVDAVAAAAQSDVAPVQASGDLGSLPGQGCCSGRSHQQPGGETQKTPHAVGNLRNTRTSPSGPASLRSRGRQSLSDSFLRCSAAAC